MDKSKGQDKTMELLARMASAARKYHTHCEELSDKALMSDVSLMDELQKMVSDYDMAQNAPGMILIGYRTYNLLIKETGEYGGCLGDHIPDFKTFMGVEIRILDRVADYILVLPRRAAEKMIQMGEYL